MVRKIQAKRWGTFIGQGLTRDRENPREASSPSHSKLTSKGSDDRDRWPYTRGWGGGIGFHVKCFRCG